MDTLEINHHLLEAFNRFFSAVKKKGPASANEDHSQLAALVGDKPIHVLLSDDDEDDRILFTEAIRAVAPKIRLSFASDGVDLMKKLNAKKANLPHLIFLDINMPLVDGMDCLVMIKSLEHLKHIPVLMYSTSAYVEEINQSYKKGANLYIQKPNNIEGLRKILTKVLSVDLLTYVAQPARSRFMLH